MKRTTWTAMALAIGAGWVVGAAAQSGTTQATGRTASGNGGTVTVTGCLQDGSTAMAAGSGSGSAASTGGSGSTGGSSGGGNFVLIGAMPSGSASPGASGSSATGTSGSTASDPGGHGSIGGMSYRLQGSEADLKKHVGHRVEVTGTVSGAKGGDMSSGGSGTSAGASSGSSPGGASGAPSGRPAIGGALKVSSMRMISSDCAGPNK